MADLLIGAGWVDSPTLSVSGAAAGAGPEGDLVWSRFLLRWCREAKAAAQGPAAVAPPDHEPRGRPDAPPGLARRLRPDPPGYGGCLPAATPVGAGPGPDRRRPAAVPVARRGQRGAGGGLPGGLPDRVRAEHDPVDPAADGVVAGGCRADRHRAGGGPGLRVGRLRRRRSRRRADRVRV